MNTLIVPCLGRMLINHVPQYLVRHPNGKLLIERCLEGIFSESYDKIIIILLQEDVDKYDAKALICSELSEKYKVEIYKIQFL